MHSVSKLLMLAAAIVLVSGLAFAGDLHPVGKIVPQKDAVNAPTERGFLDCSGAIEVDLNVGTYYGTNVGAPNNVSYYSCSTWGETGGEVVYHCVMPDNVLWEVGLSDMSCDLDLAVLDQCDEDLGCQIVVDSGVYSIGPVPGDFYFVVDGYAGAACSFTLTFTTTPYTPPNACDQVLQVPNATSYVGDTCDGMNNISSEDCSTWTENGLEDWYEIEMQPGSAFTAEVTFPDADGALWLVDACSEWTCLAYADDTFYGETESILYMNMTGAFQRVYLVVDSYGTDSCGIYEMSYTNCGGAVAVEPLTMGEVKATYR